MQRLASQEEQCAREILETVPVVMRMMRKELRRHGARVLSVPQFRTLSFVNRRKGPSLSEAAEHIGLTLPSMSALVDGLVTRGYVTRKTHPDDRRRMNLVLTERGETTLRVAREATLTELSKRLRLLTQNDRTVVLRAMRTLRALFPEESAR
jgi:MarR family transcriptional regulator for hemolysin